MYNKDLEDTVCEDKDCTKEKCDCHEDCVHEFLQHCECCDCVRCVDCGKIWEERMVATAWYTPQITYGIGKWQDTTDQVYYPYTTTNRGCTC
jgi:hypothetical protein